MLVYVEAGRGDGCDSGEKKVFDLSAEPSEMRKEMIGSLGSENRGKDTPLSLLRPAGTILPGTNFLEAGFSARAVLDQRLHPFEAVEEVGFERIEINRHYLAEVGFGGEISSRDRREIRRGGIAEKRKVALPDLPIPNVW